MKTVTKKLKLTKVNDEYTVDFGNGTVLHTNDLKQLKSDVERELSWECDACKIISAVEVSDHLLVKYTVWGK